MFDEAEVSAKTQWSFTNGHFVLIVGHNLLDQMDPGWIS
jgi:hypothetical protein